MLNVITISFYIYYNHQLVSYILQGADFEAMEDAYMTAVQNLKNSGKLTNDELCRRLENVSRFL